MPEPDVVFGAAAARLICCCEDDDPNAVKGKSNENFGIPVADSDTVDIICVAWFDVRVSASKVEAIEASTTPFIVDCEYVCSAELRTERAFADSGNSAGTRVLEDITTPGIEKAVGAAVAIDEPESEDPMDNSYIVAGAGVALCTGSGVGVDIDIVKDCA